MTEDRIQPHPHSRQEPGGSSLVLCLCPPRVESLFFLQSCGGPRIKFCRPSKSGSLGIPRLGSLMWSLEPSHECENFFGINVLQFVGRPPSGYRACTLLPSCCGFSFVLGHAVSFFGGFQRPPADGCSAASCDFGSLAGGRKCTSFYSTILNLVQFSS